MSISSSETLIFKNTLVRLKLRYAVYVILELSEAHISLKFSNVELKACYGSFPLSILPSINRLK
jgi:hypothetical protein